MRRQHSAVLGLQDQGCSLPMLTAQDTSQPCALPEVAEATESHEREDCGLDSPSPYAGAPCRGQDKGETAR
jgi:hypothetical protein